MIPRRIYGENFLKKIEEKISFASFAWKVLASYRTIKAAQRKQCLCMKCANNKLKIDPIRKANNMPPCSIEDFLDYGEEEINARIGDMEEQIVFREWKLVDTKTSKHQTSKVFKLPAGMLVRIPANA